MYRQASTRKKVPAIMTAWSGGTPIRRMSGWNTLRVTYGETECCGEIPGSAVVWNAMLLALSALLPPNDAKAAVHPVGTVG